MARIPLEDFYAPNRHFEIDISDIQASLKYLDEIPIYELRGITADVLDVGKQILYSIFEDAMAEQDLDAFPQEFRQHIRAVVSRMQLYAETTTTYMAVFMDFGQLGGPEDLEKAFHQGALLEDGTKVDGPWDPSMTLKNPDARERHVYWLALHDGDTRVETEGKDGKRKVITLKEGAWAETKKKYVKIWGDKAPEWLYLQYGQTEWDPYIKAQSVVEDFVHRFGNAADAIFRGRLDQIIREANYGQTFYDAPTYSTAPSGKVYYNTRDLKGRFRKKI